MLTRRFKLPLAASLLAGVLSACGGGDDGPPPAAATNATTQADFAAAYASGLGALNTSAGLTSTAFADTIDDAFLDAGYTKPVLRDNLAQEAAAMALSTELSSFPMVTLANPVISNCNAADVCTLTATIINADADTTSVAFTTQVKFSAGKLRLYGDQKTS